MVDNIKLLVALLFVAAGMAGFYLLADSPAVVRLASVLAGLAAAASLAYFTVAGRRFVAFVNEARDEARKVVWPTRKETVQVTAVVIAFVLVTALFLWGVDAVLFWIVKMLMGRSS